MEFFNRIFKFIREYPAVLYSLLLIIVLPLILYYNTFLIAQSFQKNIDYNLQSKALVIESILGNLFSDYFDQPELIQEKIEKITQENPELKRLRVVIPEERGEFKVIASQNSYEIGAKLKDPSFALAYSQDQTIANLTSKEGERFWKVIKPVYKKDKKIGLVSLSLSLKKTDTLISDAIFRSYLIVIIAIVLSLVLVFQHTRLFGYVALTKRLQELDRMKDQFIRMATHELQSPVVNIKGYLEALKEEIAPSLNKKQEKLFKRAEISAKNLSNLIYDILEVARIEQQRLDFTPQKIKPSEVIKESVQELKMKADKKGLDLELEIKGLGLIKANRNRLRQVLVNLIDNAIKYTFEGGVLVTAKPDKERNRYLIKVEDTGVGISAEDQKKLFSKFYRVKTKATAGIPGTGLGLWIAKEICEKMKGKIFVESIEGKGTKFTVVFPLAKNV